jgi:hypothetical protein
MLAGKPSYIAVAGARRRYYRLGLPGDQDLERQLRQRARRYDQKLLALDHVFDLAE